MDIKELKIVPQYDKKAVCCFTGNRPPRLPWGSDESSPLCREVKLLISDEAERKIKQGYSLFVSGMALGADTLFAEAVLELKKKYPSIALECALPCANQSDGWSKDNKLRHAKICNAADYVTVLAPEYRDGCMIKRNRYMVDKSSAVVALCFSMSGGTKSTLDYAKKKGVEITVLGDCGCIWDKLPHNRDREEQKNVKKTE